jgi:hypothetical protein
MTPFEKMQELLEKKDKGKKMKRGKARKDTKKRS